MKSAGKARNNGLYRHIRTSKEIIRNLLNDLKETFDFDAVDKLQQPAQSFCAGCVSLRFLCICLPVRCSMVIS